MSVVANRDFAVISLAIVEIENRPPPDRALALHVEQDFLPYGRFFAGPRRRRGGDIAAQGAPAGLDLDDRRTVRDTPQPEGRLRPLRSGGVAGSQQSRGNPG